MSPSAETGRRWQAADPLLPSPGALPDGVRLRVHEEGGRAIAVAVPTRVRPEPGTVEFAWNTADRHGLVGHVGGSRPDVAFGTLIDRWREHIAALDEPPGHDSTATVVWPSRDTAVVPALLRHGFQPTTVAAVRPPGRHVPAANDVAIRPAAPGDLDTVARLWHEEVRYDFPLANVPERPGVLAALRSQAAAALAREEPCVWLAEPNGEVAGMVYVRPPEATPLFGRDAAYLESMSVTSRVRGDGVGAALVAHVHRHLDANRVAATLLRYRTTNPLSVPFWSRMGYRPLWTYWEISPASALR